MDNLALRHLSQLVYDYCGLNYTTNLPSLELKINKRLKELSMSSWWSYIRYLEDHEVEWDILVELLTINETYFYREEKQLMIYQREILPSLAAKEDHIRIWSAGCSTGEEPYSLAILTLEAETGHFANVKIDATDINKKVLEIAKAGVYSKKSLAFRKTPKEWLVRRFHESPNTYSIRDEIKAMVNFCHLNLLDKNLGVEQEKYDVIFCRNVLIYFDEATIKKVVTLFYQALKKGGYLFLGHAETITKFDIGFETMNSNGTFYYRKG